MDDSTQDRAAHTIALEALEQVASDLDAYLAWAKRNGRTNSELVRLRDLAHAALAKAKGGKP